MSPNELSMTINGYLSIDDVKDVEDIPVIVRPTTQQTGFLKAGIENNVAENAVIDLSGDDITVEMLNHPEVKPFCGKVFLLMEIVDLKHTGNANIDPVLGNNVWSQESTLRCAGDFIGLGGFSLMSLPPQLILYSGINLTVHFTAAVWNFGSSTLPRSLDGR